MAQLICSGWGKGLVGATSAHEAREAPIEVEKRLRKEEAGQGPVGDVPHVPRALQDTCEARCSWPSKPSCLTPKPHRR
jgi:hypothetical protein